MTGSAPGWVAGQSGITKDKFEMKLFIGAIKTIFSDPRLLKATADGGEFWKKLAELAGKKFDDEEFPA